MPPTAQLCPFGTPFGGNPMNYKYFTRACQSSLQGECQYEAIGGRAVCYNLAWRNVE